MTIRTVGDLIAALEDYDPESPVMLAHQPSWPLAEVVAGLAGPEDRDAAGDEDLDPDEAPDATVWLVAGGHAWDQSPYAPRWVFDGADA